MIRACDDSPSGSALAVTISIELYRLLSACAEWSVVAGRGVAYAGGRRLALRWEEFPVELAAACFVC